MEEWKERINQLKHWTPDWKTFFFLSSFVEWISAFISIKTIRLSVTIFIHAPTTECDVDIWSLLPFSIRSKPDTTLDVCVGKERMEENAKNNMQMYTEWKQKKKQGIMYKDFCCLHAYSCQCTQKRRGREEMSGEEQLSSEPEQYCTIITLVR